MKKDDHDDKSNIKLLHGILEDIIINNDEHGWYIEH